MSSVITQYTLDALDKLENYPHIKAYIRTFDKEGEYIYQNEEEERTRKILKKEMEQIVDNGKHKGPTSWEYMMKHIRSVTNNELTREDLIKK